MLKAFIYLFLTDLVRTPFKHDYVSYAKKEPEFGPCMLQAYITAFNTKSSGVLSEQLIKAIHADAMRFNGSANPGQYKNTHNNFSISPPILLDSNKKQCVNITYSASSEGISQFVDSWLLNDSGQQHLLAFERQDDNPALPSYLLGYASGEFEITSVERARGLVTKRVVNYNEAIEFINKFLININYSCVVNPMCTVSEAELQDAVSNKMRAIIAGYNHDIRQALQADEKIAIIVKYVQLITQLHPFIDGNIRTCYILLNKLLRDEGLPLTVLMNPNRLDACSISELVQLVKLGQSHYQQIIQHTEGSLLLEANHEVIEASRVIVCSPQDLFDIKNEVIESFHVLK